MAADGKTPPTHPQGGGAGTLCVHVVSLCADTKTMTCRPCWDTHILTYQQTDRQTHRHTYINQYKHIVIPIHGCICVTYPPFGGGGGGGTRGGWIIYMIVSVSTIPHYQTNLYGMQPSMSRCCLCSGQLSTVMTKGWCNQSIFLKFLFH